MANGRFISRTIAEDKRLNELSIEAQLVYLMAIPHLDRDGLIAGDAPVLYGKVCPRRMELAGQMPEIIRQWLQSGLVKDYETDNGTILWFIGFTKNQQGLRYERESPSNYEPPPGYESDGKTGLVPVVDKPPTPKPDEAPDELRMNSGLTPAEVEVKGEVEVEVEGEDEPQLPPPPGLPTGLTVQDVTRQRAAKYMQGHHYEGIDPKLLTNLTNEVKRIYGYQALIKRPGDDKLEDKLRNEAYRLWEAGFDTAEDMQHLRQEWQEYAKGFRDKRPYGDQLYELAISVASTGSMVASAEIDYSLEEILA